MKEQKKLTMELVKSLMDESYTLVWTDYNDNLDNRLDLIHECLASKSQEKLWEKADEWYSDSEWEAYFLCPPSSTYAPGVGIK